jgi:hypothetical protein
VSNIDRGGRQTATAAGGLRLKVPEMRTARSRARDGALSAVIALGRHSFRIPGRARSAQAPPVRRRDLSVAPRMSTMNMKLNEAAPASASEKPRVWIVNADHWPRAYLRAELIERGYDATGFETSKDAVIRLLVARSQRPALLVIDLHGQVIDDKLGGLLLRERLPVLAIADATSSDSALRGVLVERLQRPLTIGAIAEAVDRFMGRGATRKTDRGDPTDAGG